MGFERLGDSRGFGVARFLGFEGSLRCLGSSASSTQGAHVIPEEPGRMEGQIESERECRVERGGRAAPALGGDRPVGCPRLCPQAGLLIGARVKGDGEGGGEGESEGEGYVGFIGLGE